jgi:GNAT superfamily N-acetyltransferase
MRIRRAQESEASALSALALDAKRQWGYAPQDIARWRPQLAISARDISSKPTFVAEIDDQIAGYYLLAPVAPGRPWGLDHLWVAPRYWRRGIGRALLTHATDTARRGGAAALAIDADPHAEPFYVACGAVRRRVVPAPIAGSPERVRPQLSLRIADRAEA